MAQLLGRRLELATGGPRDAPARQRTLRATIEWSYSLLDATQRRLFRRIAVFAGGFSAEAAGTVCGAHAADLQWLVAKSLISSSPKGNETRFTLLETIREFAFEQLRAAGELGDISAKHASYFAQLARQGENASTVQGAEQTSVIGRLESEMDNIRVALDWSFEEGDGHEDSGHAGRRRCGLRGRWHGCGGLRVAREKDADGSIWRSKEATPFLPRAGPAASTLWGCWRT